MVPCTAPVAAGVVRGVAASARRVARCTKPVNRITGRPSAMMSTVPVSTHCGRPIAMMAALAMSAVTANTPP